MNPDQQMLLEKHLELLIKANKCTNITRIDTLERGRLLHVEDSLVGLPAVEKAPAGALADMGSGAGFPGIPLAVMSGRKTTLIESVGKKANLLREFVRELGLEDIIEVYSGRTEALARDRECGFSVVTARALSSLPSLLELASPLLIEGGILVCYKSCDIDEEIEVARNIQSKVALYESELDDFILSDGVTRRRILTYVKRGEPTIALPRREGRAQKSPYKS